MDSVSPSAHLGVYVSTLILDPTTHDRLRLVAAALGVSESEAVAELLRRLAEPSAATAADPGKVPIHVVYKGTRIDAEYDRVTQGVTLLTEPLAGKSFTSPSRAAIEVIRLLNPSVNPNRNGWGFWTVDVTGGLLNTIRNKRQ